MLSLDNVFDAANSRVVPKASQRRSALDAEYVVFAVEPKIDGLALSITYVDGALDPRRDERRRSDRRRRHRERATNRERARDV